jgi:hypothetical protein
LVDSILDKIFDSRVLGRNTLLMAYHLLDLRFKIENCIFVVFDLF